MRIHDLFRHEVRIECIDGQRIEGYVHCYLSASDNDADPESIIIQDSKSGLDIELTQDEIKSAAILA